MRSSVQNSFSWCASSEANSSRGRHHAPASMPITEKPASASLHASVPPPAPVPTITKSTGSSSAYSRIGIQPPTRSGSGARPFFPRGVCRASCNTGSFTAMTFPRSARHTFIPPQPPKPWHGNGLRPLDSRGQERDVRLSDGLVGRSRFVFVAGFGLRRLPRIAPVEIHADVTAWAGRPAEADFVPSPGMAVIGGEDVVGDAFPEEQVCGHVAPFLSLQLAALHRGQQFVLRVRGQRVEARAMFRTGFGIQRHQPATPGFAQRRPLPLSVAVALVL